MTRQRLYNSISGAIISLLFFPLAVCGQVNLVKNWSFEQHTGCSGFGICNSTDVTDWYNPNGNSPDWQSTYCGGVPSNFLGYQFPRSGNAYADFVVINHLSQAYAEYVEGEIADGLVAGKKYCVTFYVSLTDSAWYAIGALGAYLSASEVCMPTYYDTLPYIPQIENPFGSPITDKVNWVPISGEYVASGGEQWITIGCFDSSAHYTFVGGGCNGCNVYGETGYYLDDVYVREIISAHAGSGKDTLICLGNKIQIGHDSATPGIRYQWLPTTGLTNPNDAQTVASPTVTTTYTLTVINDSMKGCNCPDSVSKDSITIKVDDFTGSACCNATILNGQSVVLNSTPATKYVWMPSSSLSCDTCRIVTASPTVTTTYSVTMYDSLGCTSLANVTVDVNCGEAFVPTAFSPNNDGQNDVLFVKGPCIQTMDLVIYDRWGEKVFESENVNEGWDGTYKSKPVEVGTYVYYLTATMNDGTTLNKKGNVALVR